MNLTLFKNNALPKKHKFPALKSHVPFPLDLSLSSSRMSLIIFIRFALSQPRLQINLKAVNSKR